MAPPGYPPAPLTMRRRWDSRAWTRTSHQRATSAGPMPRSSSRSSMWIPSVSSRPGSRRRIAPVMRSNQASAVDVSGGTVQLEFSLPRSHAHTAGWPESAPAAAAASRSWAATTSASEYQLRTPHPGAWTRPPDTTRKRRSPAAPPTAHGGIQFTPLMCPVNRVTISSAPASVAASAASTSRARMRLSMRLAAGCASSQRRNTLIVSIPAPAMRWKSRLVIAWS